jgi:hypothetical protein
LNLKDFEKLGIEFDPKSKSGHYADGTRLKLKSKHSGIMDLHIEYWKSSTTRNDLIIKMWHETSDGLKDPLVVMGVGYSPCNNGSKIVYHQIKYLEWHDENMNYHTTDEAEIRVSVEEYIFPNLIANDYEESN